MAQHSIAPLTASERNRFERRLRRDENTGCLLWTGSQNGHGYGEFRRNGVKLYAHRVAFLEGGGVLTDEAPHVLHDCPGGDRPACCEFSHLRAGTHAENMRDMVQKGHGARSRHGLPRGVRPSRNGSFWAHTTRDRKYVHLGTFRTVDAAAVAVAEAEARAPVQEVDRG